MESATVFAGAIILGVLLGSIYYLCVWLRCRLSPKYAAQRELRVNAKVNRAAETRRKRRNAKAERLQEWAEKNPEEPAAKAHLAGKSFSSSVSTESRDLQAVLRQRQREADEQTRREEARKAAQVLIDQQLLEWAKTNPSTSEGNRLLVEKLMEAFKKVEEADRDIRWAGSFNKEENSPEAIDTATRLAEAEARRATAQRTVDEIQAILTTLPDNQQ